MASDGTELTPEPKLGSLLAETLRADLSDAAIEAAEAGVDQFLRDGLVRDLPIVGSIASALKSGYAVRDYLFLRKLLGFLGPLEDVSSERRVRMIGKLESDPAFREHVGEHLALLLDRLDSMEKPAMLGRAFRAYLDEKIDAAILRRLHHVIDRVQMCDLPFVRPFLENPDFASLSDATKQGLINSGLAHVPAGLLNPHVWPLKEVCEPFAAYVLER